MGDQALGDARQVPDAHEEDERADPGQSVPVDVRFCLRRVLVTRHDRRRSREVAVREGDARVGRHGHGRRDARDDLEGDSRLSQLLRLLSPRPKTNGSPLSRTTTFPSRARATIRSLIPSWGTVCAPPFFPT